MNVKSNEWPFAENLHFAESGSSPPLKASHVGPQVGNSKSSANSNRLIPRLIDKLNVNNCI